MAGRNTKLEHLWYDFVQEYIRGNTRGGTSSKGEDEENFDLVGKRKNGKGNKSQTMLESNQGGKKKYLSKIKCFNCLEFRHYATKFPHKKSGNNNS